MQHAAAAATPAGRPAVVATCATCGTPMVRIGGTVVTASSNQALMPPVLLAAPTPSATLAANAAQAASVTAVPGIGPARAKMLAAAGIKTVGDLARTNPKDLIGVLRGVSAANVNVLVNNARRVNATALQ